MTRDSPRTLRAPRPALRWTAAGRPVSVEFDDPYHSAAGAREEGRHVFLDGNRLAERWRRPVALFVVGEAGFGTGLNFLLTLRLWRALAAPDGRRLHYVGLERSPPHPDDLARMYADWPDLQADAEPLAAAFGDGAAVWRRLRYDGDVLLDLRIGDAAEELARGGGPAADAWYLDGFSPRRNPAMWSDALFARMAGRSRAGTTLAGYSVAGTARRALERAGFEVEKAPGFGGKRHMLRGRRPGAARPPRRAPDRRRALVVGAGLAGAGAARALGARGWAVTVLEAGRPDGTPAVEQLALRCRLYNRYCPEAEFFLSAYLYAARELARLEADGVWHPGGLIQLAAPTGRRSPLDRERVAALYSEAVARWRPARECSAVAGAELSGDGWHLPHGGWAEAGRWRAACLDGAEVLAGAPVRTLERRRGGWRALDPSGAEIAGAGTVIIAAGPGAGGFAQTAGLPLRPAPGQAAAVPATERSRALRAVVCGRRAFFPARDGLHTIAAGYGARAPDEADRENLAAARALFAEAGTVDGRVRGRPAGARCVSPDRMPMIGPAPDGPGEDGRWPGLYLSAAHGSSGLLGAPLGGEHLASLICGEPSPLPRPAARTVDPARFLLRARRRLSG